MIVVPIGTVKSSYVLGDASSIIVANALVIKENINAVSNAKGFWFRGLIKPKNIKENKHNRNAEPKKIEEPSRVLLE